MRKNLILASTSSFRRELLRSTGLSFECVGPKVDEKQILGAKPGETARLRARCKALDVAQREPQALVIGCDQVLGLGDRLFDKAATASEARDRLREFSGKTHILHSAVCLAAGAEAGNEPLVIEEFITPVAMRMRPLSEQEIDAYVQTGEWQGCVGCYRFEEKGVHLFDEVGGDSSSIIGLPLLPLLGALRRQGMRYL
jgi:septum formation protein